MVFYPCRCLCLGFFADDIQSALALDNLALRAALAYGGTNFHDCFLLTSVFNQRLNYTSTVLIRAVQVVSLLSGHGTVRDERSPRDGYRV